jgi:soluble lytic murein transglycosylase-like protein
MTVASSLSDPARVLRGVASLALGLLAAPALSQVIEIDAQGVATTYDGPTLFNGEVAQSLTPVVAPFPVAHTPDGLIAAEARAQGLDPALLQAVAWQESRGSMAALSPKGAIGIMQLMPATAATLGVDPYDAGQNVRGGARFLKSQIDRFGSVALGLAAYNAGPGAVARHGGIPPYRETRDYVARILARWRQTAAPQLPDPVSFEVPKL